MKVTTRSLSFEPLGEIAEPDEILPVFNSNPEWTAASDNSVEPRAWDRSDAEMHLWKESMRENSVAFLMRARDSGEPIGLGGFLEPHPERGVPMIGLLLIHRDWQGRGMGREAVEAIEEFLRGGGWRSVTVTVLQACPGVRKFWERSGFEVVEETRDQDKRAVWLLETHL